MAGGGLGGGTGDAFLPVPTPSAVGEGVSPPIARAAPSDDGAGVGFGDAASIGDGDGCAGCEEGCRDGEPEGCAEGDICRERDAKKKEKKHWKLL